MNKIKPSKIWCRIVFLIFFTIFTQIHILGQVKMNVSEQSVTLQELFTTIGKQSDYLFSYVDEDIKNTKVSVNVKNGSINEILDKALSSTNLTYEINKRYVVISRKKAAIDKTKPRVTVTGIVKDSKGEPLTGATVLVKGAMTGCSTDHAGQYSLSIPDKNTVLVFSLIGFIPQAITVGNTTNIDVWLEEKDRLLEEIVVIGYGTSKRKDITGAVSSISANKLSETPAVSLNQALQGKTAGVQVNLGDNTPGGGVSVLIRGRGSIGQSNDPIYVVDGIIMQGTLNNINVEDIASIDILKDASSAAIYGSRAGNGVVIVTTKRGQEGKGKISVSMRTSIQSTNNLPRMLNAQELADIRIEGNVSSQLDDIYKNNPKMTKDQYRTQFHDLKKRYHTELPLSMFSEQEKRTLLDKKSYNWYDEIAQTGIVQDYTVSFSGANDKSNYYLSAGYYDHKGLVSGSGHTRISFRVNLEQKINSWLKLGVNSNFTDSKTPIAGATVETALGANPMYPFFVNGERPLGVPFYTAKGLSNPILSKEVDNDINSNRYSVNAYLILDIAKGLIFKSNVSADVLDIFHGYYAPSTIEEGMSDKGIGRITNETTKDFMLETTLSYAKSFGARHRIDALLGNTIQKNMYVGNNQYGTGFATDEMGYNNIGSASVFPAAHQWSQKRQWQMASFIGRLNYTLDDKYIFTATGRYDGSSKYGVNNKWGFFPSFAGAWRISSETFMSNFTFLDDMKVRTSWGQTGNSNIVPYSSFTKLTPGVTVDADGKTVSTIQNTDQLMGNPNLRWERQQQLNAGIDILAFNNKLRFSLDAYTKNSNDLVLLTPLPITTGYGEMYANVGELQNKGIEISVGGRILDGPLKWDLDVNWAANRNKLTKLYGGITKRISDPSNPTNAGWWVGQPLGVIYTYRYEGIWQWDDDRRLMDLMKDGQIGGDTYYPGENKIADLDDDNVITTADREIVGDTDPKWYGGISTSLSYKNFTLDAVFNYVYGNKVFNRSFHEFTLGAGYGFQNLSSHMLDRWTVDNANGSVPRAHSNNLDRMIISSRLMQNGSYMRLKTATLSYNVPQTLLNSIFVSNLRVYISGENLWTLTDFKGADPESPGAWGESYPNYRSFAFGINLSF